MNEKQLTRITIILLAMLITVVSGATEAAIPPEQMNYQGVLRDSAGNPLDGTFDMVVALQIARASGDAVEEERLWVEFEERFGRTHAAIALSGTVPCKVDAGYGSIEVGDLLTVSPTAGHTMRAADPAPQGTVLGKALEPFEAGTGTIRVLAMMR